MKAHPPLRVGSSRRATARHRAFTLVEVLAASVIIAIAVTASVGLSSTMAIQEELAWRTSVGLNTLENAARLWQLGLTPIDIHTIFPNARGNRALSDALEFDPDTGFVITFPLANSLENPTPPLPSAPIVAPYSTYPIIASPAAQPPAPPSGTLAYLEHCTGLTVRIRSLNGDSSSTRSATIYRPKTRPQ